GVIVGYDRMGQLDPPVTSLAGTSRIDDLDDRRAHAALCRQVLLEKREDLLPPIERLLDAIRRPVVIEETVPGAIIAVELILFAIFLELGFVLVDLLRGRGPVLVAE